MGRFLDRLRGVQPATVQDSTDKPQVVHVGGGRWHPDGWLPAGTAVGYGALMSVDYAACEQTKARSLSSLPVTVVGGDGSEPIPNHPLAALLTGRANEDMSATDLLNWHRLRCDTFGTAYWRVEWIGTTPVALWPVTCSVTRDFDRDRPVGRRTVFELSGDKYTPAGRYFADEIIAIHTHLTKNGTEGVSLAKLAAEQIGLSVDLERFYSSMLNNSNHHLGHVEIDKQQIPEQALDDLRAAIDAKAGVGNAGKAPIFAYGAHWVNDTQTMRDASLVEQQRWVLEQVCRACNVPPWKVYEASGTTYSGSQQANIDYVTDTILPDVRAIEQAFAPVFAVRNRGERLKFNMRGLMRGDDQARSNYYRQMVYSGIYTRADVRELEDMPPIEGLDRPLMPLNYGVVDEDGDVAVFDAGSKAPADGDQTIARKG